MVREKLAREALADEPSENVRKHDHDRVDVALVDPRFELLEIHSRAEHRESPGEGRVPRDGRLANANSRGASSASPRTLLRFSWEKKGSRSSPLQKAGISDWATRPGLNSALHLSSNRGKVLLVFAIRHRARE